jgi:hypothetical protein
MNTLKNLINYNQKQYTLELTEHLIRHCNPKPRQFYGSLMLKNNGKLILKVPKNLKEKKLTYEYL